MSAFIPHRLVAALCLLPSLAAAHGGLPISEAILPRDGQLLVPTRSWGVFFGSDGGPWRWICEEAINKRQDRKWALTRSGTFHVTDFAGITSSRDGGCTWEPSTGALGKLATSSVVADPIDGRRAWATTTSGAMDAPMNALFSTADDGVTWTPALEADEFLRGVALSGDGQVIYVVGAPRTKPATVLHVSKDRGKTWVAKDIAYTFDGIVPTLISPLAVDPKDPGTVYLRVSLDPRGALLKATGFGATIGELLRVEGEVTGMAFDAGRDAVLVATQKGLLRSRAGGPFAAVGNLSRAQCVQPVGDAIYACSWNYVPDEAAVARSDDGGEHFRKVFQYAETVGPTTACGAGTPVGRICPAVWQMYAAQLGIEDPVDGGGDGETTQPPGGCHCAVGRRSGSGSSSGLAALALLLLLLCRVQRRKAARPA